MSRMKYVQIPALLLLGLLLFFAGRITTPSIISASVTTSHDWSVESDQSSASAGYNTGFAGDVNGDGHLDVYVTAIGYDNGQNDEGRVELYYGAVDGLSTVADWSFESDQAGAMLGIGAGYAGDVDNDGYDDFLVGAHRWDEGTDSNTGKLYLFLGSATGLSSTPDWTFIGENAGDGIGVSIETAGDVNGDGYDDFLAGAQGYSNGQTLEGKVYAFYGSSTGPASSADWSFESDYVEALLGTSVSTAGDVNNDGYDDIVVGGQGIGNYRKGRAYAFYGSSTGLSTSPDRTYDGQEWGAKFGFSVSHAGDIDNDGYDDIIIGSYGYDNDDEGRVYAYHGSSTGLSSTADWTKDGDGWYGFSVGYAGDVNNDGYDDVIIGEPKYATVSHIGAGRASIITGSSTGLTSSDYWTKEGGSSSENLGHVVSAAGSILDQTIFRVVVGATGYENGQTDEGGAFIFYSRCD